jgi:exosortase
MAAKKSRRAVLGNQGAQRWEISLALGRSACFMQPMPAEETAIAAPATPRVAGHWRGAMLGTVALLGALWWILIDQLRLDWSTNPQYSYGWLVPLLTLYLVQQRWETRPAVSWPRHAGWLAFGAVVLALGFLPARVIREGTPEWSLVSWTMALEVVGLTLAAIGWMGGWRSLRHFAWPVGFFLVAVAWPVRFETALTQALMQQLAAITAEILNLAGVSAVRTGNLIRLGAGVVGVDEACSGVRSLQSMLMAALFLGELQRFGLLSRILFVLIGFGLAVVFNIVRALVLVTVASRQGLPELSRWHDPAGFSILVISFLILCLATRLFPKTATVPAAEPGASRAWRPLPWRWLAGLAAWLLTVEVATETWYRIHERHTGEAPGWTVRWPETQAEFRNHEIAPTTRKILAYSEGRQSSWTDAAGRQWLTFFFRWNPGRTSTIAARQHRPEVCLPAAGRTLREGRPDQKIQVGECMLTFGSYVFEGESQPLHVFFCLWENQNADAGQSAQEQDYSRANRLQRVLSGQRNLGQQSLEVIMAGFESSEEAEAAFREQMKTMLAATRRQNASAP